jgi:hypothetical protein
MNGSRCACIRRQRSSRGREGRHPPCSLMCCKQAAGQKIQDLPLVQFKGYQRCTYQWRAVRSSVLTALLSCLPCVSVYASICFSIFCGCTTVFFFVVFPLIFFELRPKTKIKVAPDLKSCEPAKKAEEWNKTREEGSTVDLRDGCDSVSSFLPCFLSGHSQAPTDEAAPGAADSARVPTMRSRT